jgi:ComF family protein
MLGAPEYESVAAMRVQWPWRRSQRGTLRDAAPGSLKAWIDAALDLLYPPHCGGCGCFGEGWLCPACQSRVRWLGSAGWLEAVPGADGQRGVLPVLSVAVFAPPLREAIHGFKYDGSPQLAGPFSLLMADAWRACGLRADLIVPVPLHPSRVRERGYNQSALLAQGVSRACAVPHAPNALRRIRYTEQQAHLSATARRANVHAAFVADGALVAGRRILLVDDVLTTGATLNECTGALVQAGARDVVALTLARAQA